MTESPEHAFQSSRESEPGGAAPPSEEQGASDDPVPPPLLNRELSWLAFNGRVLQEAKDPRVPLFDRLNFLAIFYSNLDEFFRVRVASLRSLLRLKKKKLRKLEIRPQRLLREIHYIVTEQQETFNSIFRGDILPALEANGIFLLNDRNLTEEQGDYLRHAFRDVVRPYLHPRILQEGQKPPFLEAGQIYLVTELWPEPEMTLASERPEYGILRVPSPPLPRFMLAPGEGFNVLFLEDVIRHSLSEVFPAYETGSAHAVKLSRDADLYLEDEFEGDLVQKIRKSLTKRETGLPARFLYDFQAPYALISFLKEHLGLEDEDLVPGGRYHNLQDLSQFPRPRDANGLIREPLDPLPHPELGRADSILDAVALKDRILHFPYQSFEPVLRFLGEAAEDPEVDRIWITLYRVARDSAVVKALIRAARNGVRVTAFVEVKARFDEAQNLKWAEEMTAAGVHTVYSMPGIKVHAKLALVSRKKGGARQLFAYLATGNLNEITSRLYCDHGLLTSDPRLTRDVEEVFRFLCHEVDHPTCRHILVSPYSLRDGLTTLMRHEMTAAEAGEPSGMVLKMNSLEDKEMITTLLQAGAARVPTNLIVRGICRFPLGQDGRIGSIRGRSILDRFLEHARVFRFVNRGDPILLLSSADLMKRNLDHRVEVAFPIYDPGIREEMDHLLHFQLSDNTKARILDASMDNSYVGRRAGEPRVEAQAAFYRWLENRIEP
ncbi:MAG: polyphosphate kinase 1 [Longimicrobiales bacterium]